MPERQESTIIESFNTLGANPRKWPDTLKQFVGKLPTNCLSVFGHFVGIKKLKHYFTCENFIDKVFRIRTPNYLVRKRPLSHLAKLASLAKLLTFPLRTKWLRV